MLSEVCKNITPSATVELDGLVTDMRNNGVDIISLNIGEPDFITPDFIREAGKKALDEGKTKYVNVQGIMPLREEICRKLKRENHAEYLPEQICVSTGAKQALNNAMIATINAGDEVIIPIPGWVSYVEIVKIIGAVPVCVKTCHDYQLDIAAIEAAITDKTKAIIINTPNNPTGAVYTRESLEALEELVVKHDLYVIADEVYEKLTYGNKEHVSFASLSKEAYEHCVIVNGLSKTYAMTGWRIGYTAAPKEIAKGIRLLQGHTTSNSTTFVQWAAVEALKNGEESVRKMVAEYERRKKYTYDRLTAIEGFSCENVDGAFYLMPDISYYYGRKYGDKTIRNTFDFCNYILEEAHVAVIPGDAFQAPNNIRVSYTNDMEKIKEGLDRLEAALKKLD